MAQTGKIAEVIFEEVLDTIEDQTMFSDMCERFEPNAANMQNANNFVWRPVEQQAPVIQGWDLSGQEQDIIEETYPAILEDPYNDFVQQRADDLRDMEFWRRRGRRSGMQQVVKQNQSLAEAVVNQGSLFFDGSADTSGFDFISRGQAVLNEQQRSVSDRYFLLNDRTARKFATDLAGRQTLQGRPEDAAWKKGQIGANVAEFDVYTASFLPTLAGGADPATTVTGDQSFAPEGGSVDAATGVVTNVDYRSATIPVADSSSYNVGDKVTFANTAVDVVAVGISDQTNTGQSKTFTIVAKPTATSITVYPKPIAADDPALTTLEAKYANIDTQILDTATVNRLNTTATNRTNIFWDREAIEVLSGSIPAELFEQFDGKKVISETMNNGQEMYMIYDANIENMNFRYRLFTWWGITVKDPQRCGVALSGV